MDILGVGFPELMVILIIAMIVFGPRRLPEIASKAGKIVRDLRGMSQGLLLEWQREITVATRLDELEETRKELTALKEELGQTQREIGQQAQKEARQFQKQVTTEVSKAEDTLKAGVEQISEALPTDSKESPDTDQPNKDDTPEITSEEKPQQEAVPDTPPTVKTPKPIVKPKVSKAVKINGRPDNPAPSSEQPSQPKEALNE